MNNVFFDEILNVDGYMKKDLNINYKVFKSGVFRPTDHTSVRLSMHSHK